MKTVKTTSVKSFKSGFLIKEDHLRRLISTVEPHAAKLNCPTKPRFTATLRDGSVVETDNVEDILSLDNSGQKLITELGLLWKQKGNDDKEQSVSILFTDGNISTKGWDSITCEVIGDSRDDVFVAAAEIEDRLRVVQKISWSRFLQSHFWGPAVFILGFAAMAFWVPRIEGKGNRVQKLKELYESGGITDPIQAMIFLEETSETSQTYLLLLLMACNFGIPFLLFWMIRYALPKLRKSYVFYWSDEIDTQNRRDKVFGIITIAILLSFAVSVAAGLVIEVF